MKREIEFKALFQHLATGQNIWLHSTVNHKIDTHGYVQKTEWLQFTGLKGQNGAEIYESDIIQKIHPNTSVLTKPKIRGVTSVVQFGKFKVCDDSFGVEYFATGWFFEYSDKSGTASVTDEFEVIGNIFEHPELLTENL